MSPEISDGCNRFVAAPDGVLLPIPTWIRSPETGKTIHIPPSATCIANRNFTGAGYHININCRGGEMSGDAHATTGGTMRGTSVGGFRILARIAQLGPVAGRLVAQLAGRAVSGVAATVLLPDALATDVMVHGSHEGHSITYIVFE